MSLSFEEVIKLLRGSLSFEEIDIELTPAKSGINKLKEKTEKRLGKRKDDGNLKRSFQLCYNDSIEIGNITGKELLRILVQLVKHGNILSIGSCVFFSVDGKAEMALIRFEESCFEAYTHRLEEKCKKGLYNKLFDDSAVSYLKRKPKMAEDYTNKKVNELRQQINDKLNKLMTKEIRKSDALWRNAIFGILHEILKLEAVNTDNPNKAMKDIPLAASIQMAVESNQTGSLQDVFGEHGLYNKWEAEFVPRKTAELGTEPSKDTIYKEGLRYRRKQRLDAVKRLMKRHIPSNKYGRYNADDVQKVIEKTKKMFT